MGLTKKLHITISHDEADSYYRHSERLQEYLRQEAGTELFAQYCFLSDKTDAPSVLREVEAVIRAADPRTSPAASIARSNESTTEFFVSLDLDAMDALHFPFRFVLDRELLRAGEVNEPQQFLGQDAYETLGHLAVKLARANPRIVRLVYETPGLLFPPGDKRRAQKDTDKSGFDFGRGPTALDSHVAWLVTDHHGYDYAKQWTPWQWQISHACLNAFTHSETHYVMDNTAPLPPWLLKAVDTHATPDTDSPGPMCFAARSTAIDWFALAKDHPEELVLSQWFEPAPTVQQIEKALRAAQARSAEVDLWVMCGPLQNLAGPLT
ncbi:hypothetical protein [Arthrobacter glacialis]|uniref:Uncharacterized protein n=1 Tax=Arthrobacter glacialis TaxID=1664 RepID=A0A2S3ZSG6_ARTGL|nr:hypothetical protein [Arthrobacter glacialis]POH72185.1 hypothetical protein CVS27_16975 [Arthrobacter glacialis]